jgi:acetyl-CoA carboxylase carboxyltransferase component
VVAIANDLTYQSGAFSPREDALFRWATELALEERLPVVYLAANSGEGEREGGGPMHPTHLHNVAECQNVLGCQVFQRFLCLLQCLWTESTEYTDCCYTC